ncbi:AAA family ATPase [Photobacterium sp. 1_MG-2023]|uniref:AAA family ATPase n=1 Tax=Photobacterium sp. 1_MG-2023 TaxID=3062646 RepID=UPI0026E36270|nr:AAA family ATPase [Photobacterium sp. 1_MG-2023]MDO6707396.1 AAA family ATPase [Photobacterium sp. 1_MG-2023]
MNHRIVFTGGPGAGKTAVITYLRHLGYQTASEVSRQVISPDRAVRSHLNPCDNDMVNCLLFMNLKSDTLHGAGVDEWDLWRRCIRE